MKNKAKSEAQIKRKSPIVTDGTEASPKHAFPVVGIGASAGGLEAFTQLLDALPIDTGMAFILVQHLDPKHGSLAPAILSRTTRMPVLEVEDGMPVVPNHVYVIPPNFNMAILHGVLSLLPRTETRGQHMVIDFFFQSLALDQKGRAVGVVLSGTASDGTQGLKAIKDEGGLAIAQDPESAKYDGMPKSAIASGIVDLILPPDGIAKELARISKHPYIAAACEATLHPHAASDDQNEDKEDLETSSDNALRKIFVMLRKHTQVDFSHYKQTTLKRRIQRRMMVRKTESLYAYAEYLHEHNDEIKALYADILINVTEFFRDPESFKALTDNVFPNLMKGRDPGATIRIWVPGCSTGEEAYSLAILLLEFLGDKGAQTPIQIFATDISESAIQKARAGVYSEGIERGVNKERLRRFFDKVEGGYKINKAVRDLCLFSRHDVTVDPPFARLDLVSCHNVLIYFATILQKRVIPIFHYALNPDGFLWLGKSESPGGAAKLFTITDKTHRIYTKTNIPTPKTFRFPVSTYVAEFQELATKAPERVKGGTDFQRDADRIALAKSPPSVVVNADLEILQFRGRTVPYLEHPSGLTNNNLLKMVRQELLPGLRVTIQAATKQNTQARQEGLSFEVDGKRRTVNIEVTPVNPLAPPRQRNFVIFFEEASFTPVSAVKLGPSGNTSDKKSQRISELEQDFSASKQYQQTIVDDFEATQEELTAANEELQSTNEELQSTNEELETAKEELQSSNEELTTVNDEMNLRNSELLTLSSDLNNLLSSVEIPILIVGNDHRIRKFTPNAEKVFKLIPGDVGRLIGDIKADFDLDLDALVSEVTRSLRPQEKEIKDLQGRWMRLQIRPYKRVDNRIDGAVITLMDIEALKKQVKESKKAQDYLTSVAETVQLPLVILDDRLRLRSANRAFWEHFKLSPQIVGKNFFAIPEMQDDSLHQIQKLLTETLRAHKEVKNVEVNCEFPHIGRRSLLLSASLIQWMGEMSQESEKSQESQGSHEPQEPQEPQAILLSFDDITERRSLEKDLARESKNVRLFESITAAANEAKSLEAGLQIFLEQICTHACWPVGHANLLSSGGAGEFISSKVWYLDDPNKFARLKEETELLTLASGVGLAGKVFTVRKVVSTNNLTRDLVPQKAKLAEEVGIKSALGFPVFVGDSIVAVLEFFSTECKEADRNLIEVITHVIPQLGRVFERKLSDEDRAQILLRERQARSDAERGNRAKDLFLATLSHELRTPLTSILSWAQMLRMGRLDAEKVKKGAGVIEQSARAQAQLIDDLLDISRIIMGKIAVEIKETDPVGVIHAAVELVRPLAMVKAIEIKTVFDSKTGWVSADPIRLQQVVWNLLTNAVKFSPKNSIIEIRLGPVQDRNRSCAEIKVTDSGKGIDPSFLPQIFNRFSQEDSSSTRVHGGLGLGLSIVRNLIELQGGTVRAESSGEGKGATFTVNLPLASAKDSAETHNTPDHQKVLRQTTFDGKKDLSKLDGLRILFVDDDESTRETVTLLLESLGAQVLAVVSAREALAALPGFKANVMVSDIAMPCEDGYSLMRKVRALGPEHGGNIPALALTAYATGEDAKRATDAGFQSHLAKPVEASELARVLAVLAGRK